MKYIETGETIETGRKISPVEFAHVLNRGIVLTLEAYNKLGCQKACPHHRSIDRWLARGCKRTLLPSI